jgi:hypothetical protein
VASRNDRSRCIGEPRRSGDQPPFFLFTNSEQSHLMNIFVGGSRFDSWSMEQGRIAFANA